MFISPRERAGPVDRNCVRQPAARNQHDCGNHQTASGADTPSHGHDTTDPATAEAVTLVRAVEQAYTPDTVLVCDMAVAGYWVGGYASAAAPRRLAYPVGWGTLGFGPPPRSGPPSAGVR